MNQKKIEAARKMLLQYIEQQAKDNGITQEQLADKTGMIQSNISRMLAGKYPPTLDNFIKLADAAGCYLFVIDKDDEENDLVKMMQKRWKREDDKQ